MDYEYVFKLEDLEADEDCLKWVINPDFEQLLSLPSTPGHRNTQNKDHLPESDVTEIYLGTVDRDDLKKLYEVYEKDFVLLDYQFDIGYYGLGLGLGY
jgi:hypothetical protein